MVYLAKQKNSGMYCALKQIDKTVIKRLGKMSHAKIEKKILITAKSPFLLKALLCFQDKHFAWLALEYCPGGDLREFLQVVECFEEQEAVLYFAEMIMGVQDLHKMGYLHRDLKPANFLIDKCGHIKLADFGLAKNKYAIGKSKTPSGSDDSEAEKDKDEATGITKEELDRRKKEIWRQKTRHDQRVTLNSTNLSEYFQINHPMKNRLSPKIKIFSPLESKLSDKNSLRKNLGYSIVGSPEYMSPEVTSGRHQGGACYGEEVDWWSLGCVFFEMIFGSPPFFG